MSSLISTVRRWRLAIQFDWLANGLFVFAARKRHNAWMSAGEGLCALATLALIFLVEWKGAWWALGLYPDSTHTLKDGALVGGAIVIMMMVAGLIYVACENFARGVFLTSVGHHDLERAMRGESAGHVTDGWQRRLKDLLTLNPTCDLTPLEWWLAQRVWSDKGERTLREARLQHAFPKPSNIGQLGRERL